MSNQENIFVIKVPKVLRNIVNKYIVFLDFVLNDENLDSIMEYYHTFKPNLDEKIIYKKFGPVCSDGNLKTFQFLHSLLITPEIYSRRIMLRVFEGVCENGHLNIAEWFVTKYEINYTTAEKDEIFTVVCRNGHMEMAGFLYDLFGMQEEHSTRYTEYYTYFKVICENDHLDMAKWFVEILPYEGFQNSQTFEAVCKRGHLEMAKWLNDVFKISESSLAYWSFNTLRLQDERNLHCDMEGRLYSPVNLSVDGNIFEIVCIKGYLEMAKWLKDTFDNIEFDTTDTFKAICINNHISMLRWLTKTFEITDRDISDLIHIFAIVCSIGNMEIAQYLDTNFRIKVARLSSIPGDVLDRVCRKGDLKMAEFVKKKFNIVENSFRERAIIYTFEDVCKNGFFEMAKWLEENFRVSSKNELGYSTFEAICIRNDLSFAKWLFKTFKPDYWNYSRLFEKICKKGYFEMAKWLHNKGRVSTENFDVVGTFEVLVEKGNLDMAHWLALAFNMEYSQLRKNQYLSGLILQNKIELYKWLLSEPKFTEAQCEDISKKEYKKLGILDEYKLTPLDKSDLFMYAFEKGDRLLAKFFIKEFRLHNILSLYMKNTMIECCAIGRNEILTWLVDNLQLTKEDLMFDDKILINTAVHHHQTAIVSYLNQLGIEQDIQ